MSASFRAALVTVAVSAGAVAVAQEGEDLPAVEIAELVGAANVEPGIIMVYCRVQGSSTFYGPFPAKRPEDVIGIQPSDAAMTSAHRRGGPLWRGSAAAGPLVRTLEEISATERVQTLQRPVVATENKDSNADRIRRHTEAMLQSGDPIQVRELAAYLTAEGDVSLQPMDFAALIGRHPGVSKNDTAHVLLRSAREIGLLTADGIDSIESNFQQYGMSLDASADEVFLKGQALSIRIRVPARKLFLFSVLYDPRFNLVDDYMNRLALRELLPEFIESLGVAYDDDTITALESGLPQPELNAEIVAPLVQAEIAAPGLEVEEIRFRTVVEEFRPEVYVTATADPKKYDRGRIEETVTLTNGVGPAVTEVVIIEFPRPEWMVNKVAKPRKDEQLVVEDGGEAWLLWRTPVKMNDKGTWSARLPWRFDF